MCKDIGDPWRHDGMKSRQVCNATDYYFFFFNDTATTEIYTLSLHDALPISNHIWQSRQEKTGRIAVAQKIDAGCK